MIEVYKWRFFSSFSGRKILAHKLQRQFILKKTWDGEENDRIFSFPLTTAVFLHYRQKLNRGETKQRVFQDVVSWNHKSGSKIEPSQRKWGLFALTLLFCLSAMGSSPWARRCNFFHLEGKGDIYFSCFLVFFFFFWGTRENFLFSVQESVGLTLWSVCDKPQTTGKWIIEVCRFGGGGYVLLHSLFIP